MPWRRRLPTTFHLNDGRAIATLAEARDVMLALPRDRQSRPQWQDAAQALLDAAYRNRQAKISDAHARFAQALKSEGLI